MIKQMIEDGLSISRIAHRLKIEKSQLKQIITENNYSLLKEQFDESKILKIVELYRNGVSAKTLGKKYSIDKRRIQRWAAEQNLLRSLEDSHRIIFFNQRYFDDIDTKAKAYWLGFFYADVYNSQSENKVNMCLQGGDYGHLEKLADALEIDRDRIERGFTAEGHATATLPFYSKHMCEKLAEKGCPQAKSFIIKYPYWIQENLHSHFIRGMFDGDGCLTYRQKQKEWKFNIVSTKEGCEGLQKYINKYTSLNVRINYISETNNNTYNVETSGNERISKILDWLYLDAEKEIKLDRKYEKYLELKQQQDNRNNRLGRKNYFMTDIEKIEIKKEFETGMSLEFLSEKYGYHKATIGRFLGIWHR